jgi:hypothetical protein
MPGALHAIRRGLVQVPILHRLVRFLPKPRKEDHRAHLLQRLPRNAVCAEVGVWKGAFSARILATQPATLHLIDPWLFQSQFPERAYGGTSAASQADMDAIYQTVCQRFAGRESVRIHRQPFRDFAAKMARGELDWIYIDGDHSEEAVREDLSLAWDLVKSGGIIAGDDYRWRDSDGSEPVRAAVERFCRARGIERELIGNQFLLRKTGGRS